MKFDIIKEKASSLLYKPLTSLSNINCLNKKQDSSSVTHFPNAINNENSNIINSNANINLNSVQNNNITSKTNLLTEEKTKLLNNSKTKIVRPASALAKTKIIMNSSIIKKDKALYTSNIDECNNNINNNIISNTSIKEQFNLILCKNKKLYDKLFDFIANSNNY